MELEDVDEVIELGVESDEVEGVASGAIEDEDREPKSVDVLIDDDSEVGSSVAWSTVGLGDADEGDELTDN